MENAIIEAQYPLSFREKDVQNLGHHLKNRDSVVLVGMKRVGISNFLRFFIHHKNIVSEYISPEDKHLFIPVDLNDLVEREIVPFWTLTLKRIADIVSRSALEPHVYKEIDTLFKKSIQTQDLFITIDSVRKSLITILESGVYPNIFFLRFDRMKDVVNQQFFDNIQGLKDATHNKLAYVFTSYRSLDQLSPQVFSRASLSVFAQDMYIKPASHTDIQTIYDTYKKKYKLDLTVEREKDLFELVDGYIQYVQLALISLHEKQHNFQDKEALFQYLIKDERIILQSEELWESLEKHEQAALLKVSKKQSIAEEEKMRARYIWDTGMVMDDRIFSPLFAEYIKNREGKTTIEGNGVEFSKKEHLLFSFLQKHIGEICERDRIIEAVWPEVEALGVSDWAIDRLVARVRNKLKLQKSTLEIQTIKTRGYKLIQT